VTLAGASHSCVRNAQAKKRREGGEEEMTATCTSTRI
jgi:hypothetical protein